MTNRIYCELHEQPPQLAFNQLLSQVPSYVPIMTTQLPPIDMVNHTVTRPARFLVEQAKVTLREAGPV